MTATRALVWVRAASPGTVEVVARAESGPEIRVRGPVQEDRDRTALLRLRGLVPGSRIRFSVRLLEAGGPGRAIHGSFRTPPRANVAAPVRMAFGGDLGGQNVCRDLSEGFGIFHALDRYAPDVFVALGDMIYADGECLAHGRYRNAQLPGSAGAARDLESFRAHWRYARADPSFRKLLSHTSYVATWDDHEVSDDFGPLHDTGAAPPEAAATHLLPLGLRAFLEYNPVRSAGPASPHRLFRSLRFGRHLELFVLDTRQYRDSNAAPDASRGPPKSLLGRAQRRWLERALASSDATWKVIASSVPLSIPTGVRPGEGRDGWANGEGATGFETELWEIVQSLEESSIRESVWITADVHHAALIRYTPLPVRDPALHLHEVVAPALWAGVGAFRGLDPSFGPELRFVHAPQDPSALHSLPEARGYMGFGALEVDASGRLTIRLLDAQGASLYAETLLP
ncbi:MAG: alkaline phosphatase D family protein [Myxococcota bacterium]